MTLHPIETTEELRLTYERYLKTIYPFQDDNLRDALWQRLGEKDRLIKGPLLEASPPFKSGRSIAELIHQNVLDPEFRRFCAAKDLFSPSPLPIDRPLYAHQDQAIEVVATRQENLVVATGTGSGKTESFLIPILNHLFREKAAGSLSRPGVRALLLYPMNALANDQLIRLRHLLANYPDITFGRYTGETLEKPEDARERFLSSPGQSLFLPNELHSRLEMRARPPHILLTNYAMLEYLLLRPQDTELFDGETGRFWRFIVVDEAHVYDGASGMEVAMLLRRLKDRVVESRPGRLTCIATSATIGKGEQAQSSVAEFATDFFGETFLPENVVLAQRLALADPDSAWGRGQGSMYKQLDQLEEKEPGPLRDCASDFGVPQAVLQR
ncbi:MAG: DEAD/DEAH box helicase, partial [Anaerolineales bacterium]|nr:DEAD/DEAH box helicase [Anaerolineales bacterium]